jgi:hypothetical protein
MYLSRPVTRFPKAQLVKLIVFRFLSSIRKFLRYSPKIYNAAQERGIGNKQRDKPKWIILEHLMSENKAEQE